MKNLFKFIYERIIRNNIYMVFCIIFDLYLLFKYYDFIFNFDLKQIFSKILLIIMFSLIQFGLIPAILNLILLSSDYNNYFSKKDFQFGVDEMKFIFGSLFIKLPKFIINKIINVFINVRSEYKSYTFEADREKSQSRDRKKIESLNNELDDKIIEVNILEGEDLELEEDIIKGSPLPRPVVRNRIRTNNELINNLIDSHRIKRLKNDKKIKKSVIKKKIKIKEKKSLNRFDRIME